jgi:hypothetical protein
MRCAAITDFRRAKVDGFSLIEVTVAMGIFAFVIVGIIGLFPVAMRQQADAAFETRAKIIAEQIFQGIQASASLDNVFLPPLIDAGKDGKLQQRGLKSGPILLGFADRGTALNHIYPGAAEWENGDLGSGTTQQGVTYLARASVQQEGGNPALQRVTVQVGYPATLPVAARRNENFTKLFYSP